MNMWKNKKISMGYTYLTLLLFATLPLAFIIVMVDAAFFGFRIFYVRVILYLLVIPITIIGYSIFLTIKKFFTILFIINLIVSIFTIVILVYFGTAFPNERYAFNYKIVDETEEIVNFEFPERGFVRTSFYFENIYNSYSVIRFTNKNEIIDFETAIIKSNLWIESHGLYPDYENELPKLYVKSVDFHMIYNINLDEYNTHINDVGSYDMIYIAYDPNKSILVIVDYTLIIEEEDLE